MKEISPTPEIERGEQITHKSKPKRSHTGPAWIVAMIVLLSTASAAFYLINHSRSINLQAIRTEAIQSYDSHNYSKAAADFQLLLEHDPADATARLDLAQAFSEISDFAGADAEIAKLEKSNQTYTNDLIFAQIYFFQGSTLQESQSLLAAFKLASTPTLQLSVAQAANSEADYSVASTILKSLANTPEKFTWYEVDAITQQGLLNTAAAQLAALKGYQLAPPSNTTSALAEYANILLDDQQYVKAEPFLTTLVATTFFPQKATYVTQLNKCFVETNEVTKGIQVLEATVSQLATDHLTDPVMNITLNTALAKDFIAVGSVTIAKQILQRLLTQYKADVNQQPQLTIVSELLASL